MRLFKRLHQPLRDYLYVDQKRLDSYIEQVSSTEARDKSPSFDFGASPNGPSFVRKGAVRFRPKNTHEKVCELLDHLGRCDQLSRQRPMIARETSEELSIPDFVLEECQAIRILIPAVRDRMGDEGIVVWVSEWPLDRQPDSLRPPGMLCLIQDRTLDDKRSRVGFEHSGYTWLQSLLYQLHQQDPQTVLGEQFPFDSLMSRDWDIMYFQNQLQGEMLEIRTDPVQWLGRHACVLSAQRRISTLYRIRVTGIDQVGPETGQDHATISTFAYAIAVWSSPARRS